MLDLFTPKDQSSTPFLHESKAITKSMYDSIKRHTLAAMGVLDVVDLADGAKAVQAPCFNANAGYRFHYLSK